MNESSLLVLVLASLGYVQAQKCLEPGATLEDQQTAKLCYGANQASIVKLNCNWEANAFRFELEVIPDVASKEIVFRREAVGYASPSQGRIDLPEIKTGNRACPAQSPRFLQPYSFLSTLPAVNMVIKDGETKGEVWYDTTVVITEYRYTDNTCSRMRFFVTDVHLSCCAKPKPTPNNQITVPLHQYCNLTICKVDPAFDCICDQGTGAYADQWRITATMTRDFASLGDNIDFQLETADTFDTVLGHGPNILSMIPENATQPLPAELNFTAHPRNSSPRGSPYVMTINPHVFHDTHNNGVSVMCKGSFCIKNRNQEVASYLSYLPDCRPWASR